MRLKPLKNQFSEAAYRDLSNIQEDTTGISYITLMRIGKTIIVLFILMAYLLALAIGVFGSIFASGAFVFSIFGDTQAASIVLYITRGIIALITIAVVAGFIYELFKKDT